MPKVAKQKLIHPNSRKAQQLSKKQHHNIRVERKKDELNIKQQILLQKLLWFKNNLNEDEVVCAKNVLDLIERYLNRFSDELEQIDIINNIKGRTGIQHAARKDSIKFTIDQEKNDFQTCGLDSFMALVFKHDFGYMVTMAGLNEVQLRRTIFDHFIEQLGPYIGNNVVNVDFQVVQRL
ncbi:translation machinery-associated protein 16-like [Centruroides sculpturatus]|uniref:translation machinery-associated protein 16-like n=1 Tax=Centruroides sculpturatus TaxID=218467 RepID=UPI000C6E9740|nr:translation machinery-associated protein 16-like [Centruroides sculpturatus]